METNTITGVDHAFYYITGISLFFLISITITMIIFVFKYKKEKNPIPSQVRGNLLLELIWIVIPTFIALTMFYVGWQGYLGLRQVPSDAIKFNVEAQMFEWHFIYPNKKEADQLIVPQGSAAYLNITSKDVIHSFYVPAFRIKVDAVPKMNTYAWFRAEKLGEYDLFCAEYCGLGHADMTSVIKVVSKEDYASFIASDSDDWDDFADSRDEDEDEDEE